ncbi:hypothetical protein [Nitrosomonas communis]|uniref:Uncharacterized protein n=1 Tax=Nitrosomonas communis TaxID=44574 RepID=A0A1I4M9T0_9PROT|nr:hypothetical protein [Nitrosomonas communis]SFL99906.1 hypothetical protein SAMN05421863_100925 [Nitrosomonas communis]
MSTVTIPIWLRDPQGFVAAVRRYAEPTNPLAQLATSSEAQPGSQQALRNEAAQRLLL